jgi:hypothetical protein
MGVRELKVLLLALLLALLAGCASAPEPVPSSAPAATQPAPGTATAPVTSSGGAITGSSPVEGLLGDARAACDAGDLETGLARLDRALRIDPQSAALYLEMARCYAGAGDPGRAAAAAERGMAFCYGGDCRLLRRYLGS